MTRGNLFESREMPKTSSLIAVILALAGLCLAVPTFGAGQTSASSPTTAKPAASRKVTTKARPKRKPRERVQTTPTPARISEIQSALAAQGVYKGQPNGKWDNSTIQAMKDYQSAHGLTATGKLDALTLQKLGLGSEIAGRAAPLPISQPQAAPAVTEPQQTP